ncbi:MAG: carbon monoxide dehydrogenase [Bdellovibrionales bacterium GWB1_55_8]|nr:MAG: carbon monoxide dehydrogenase [Bdellovibrionales bacterium GWB1_55_8]
MTILRKEGREKARGAAFYVDDIAFSNLLHGTTVRSSIARGCISGISYLPGVPWDEFTIVTSKDIPGKNCIAHILHDQPCLADGLINHPEEPVVLLAHPDRHVLEKARRLVQIETKELPAVFTIEDSLARKQVIWGADNLFKSLLIEKGNVDSVWAGADRIIEGEYSTGAQEQLYLEPNGMVAKADNLSGVTVWGSMQCPFYVHHALVTALGLQADKVRVIQTETGGGFGGKEDYPSVIATHAALLSLKAGKPVKMIYDRAEDLAATTKRHPSRTRHKTAVSKSGKLLGMEVDFAIDGGAYATISSVVLSRGAIHAAGPYLCPNVRIRGHAVATNSPPNGAFRGFGAPQSIFALERHMDTIAAELGIPPEELRRRNFLHQGDQTATGQVLREKPDMEGLLEKALNAAGYHEKRKAFAEANANPETRVKKGIGFSAFMHGAGFTGSGEKMLASVAAVQATAAGRIEVLASSTEIGQGANTVFAQIVSHALGIPSDWVDVVRPDTSIVPNSGPTVASRTTMIVGKLVENAALGLREVLRQSGRLGLSHTPSDFQQALSTYVREVGPLRSDSTYKQPSHIEWDDMNYRGDAYGTFAWAVYVAEVSVDTVTYETKVDHFVAAQEVGKVIHPMLAAGQIEGGVTQGIGFAIYEEVVNRSGRMANNRLTNYIIPTSMDTPRIQVIFAENPYAHGPQGAKGIGELPLDGAAPAILNAVSFATGAPIHQIPMTPEHLLRALHGAKPEGQQL